MPTGRTDPRPAVLARHLVDKILLICRKIN